MPSFYPYLLEDQYLNYCPYCKKFNFLISEFNIVYSICILVYQLKNKTRVMSHTCVTSCCVIVRFVLT